MGGKFVLACVVLTCVFDNIASLVCGKLVAS
jgi:hypothetical protein